MCAKWVTAAASSGTAATIGRASVESQRRHGFRPVQLQKPITPDLLGRKARAVLDE
jgi:hypothetical protein